MSRRYDDDLAYGDGFGSRPQRWDRETFERARARSRGAPRMSESFRFEERDRFDRGDNRRNIETDDRFDSRGTTPGRSRIDERDRFRDDNRYDTPRRSRQPDFLEEDRYRSGGGGRELAPYKDRWEKDDYPQPPPRPQWDAYDRRRYPEPEQPGGDVKISLRVGSPKHEDEDRYRDDDRRYRDDDVRSSYRDDDRRYREDDHKSSFFREEDRSYRDRDASRYREVDVWESSDRNRPFPPQQGYREPYRDQYRDPYYDDHRDPRIVREVEREIQRRAPSHHREYESREHRESDSFEEISRSETRVGSRSEVTSPTSKRDKRGKTKMPKRLVQKRVLLELDHDFYEEEDFFYVRRALNKDEIDEVIRISEKYKEESKSSYRYEEQQKTIEAPPPPPLSFHEPEKEITETVTTKVIENPTEEDYARYRGGELDRHSDHGSIHSEHGSHHSDDIRSHHSRVPETVGPALTRSETRESKAGYRSEVGRRSEAGHRSEANKSQGGLQVTNNHGNMQLEAHHGKDHGRSKSRGRSKSMHQESYHESSSRHHEKEKKEESDSESDHHKSRHKRHHSRRPSRRHNDEIYEENVEESGSIGGPLTLLVPGGHRKSRDIKAEIRALEDEKKTLRRERTQKERDRSPDYELVEHKDRGEVRIEKDRRGNMKIVRPD